MISAIAGFTVGDWVGHPQHGRGVIRALTETTATVAPGQLAASHRGYDFDAPVSLSLGELQPSCAPRHPLTAEDIRVGGASWFAAD